MDSPLVAEYNYKTPRWLPNMNFFYYYSNLNDVISSSSLVNPENIFRHFPFFKSINLTSFLVHTNNSVFAVLYSTRIGYNSSCFSLLFTNDYASSNSIKYTLDPIKHNLPYEYKSNNLLITVLGPSNILYKHENDLISHILNTPPSSADTTIGVFSITYTAVTIDVCPINLPITV